MTTENTTRTDEAIASALEAALRAAETTGTFVVEQAPDVVQQLLLFSTVKYAGLTLAFSATTAAVVILAAKSIKVAKNKRDANPDSWRDIDDYGEFWVGCTSYVVATATGIAAICYAMSLLKITLAPKVWLLEYAASLAK